MAQQLTFDWPVGISLGAEDFFVSEANAQAYAMIRDPAGWPNGKLALTGPAGCGKSHLARVFVSDTGAAVMSGPALNATTSDGPVVIDDADRLPAGAEETLFHLHNNLAAAGLPLLLTARTPPSRWAIGLPDLASRMQATTPVAINDPDDALLEALLMKLFADRQLMPAPEVVTYLARRIERSFSAASAAVAQLDRAALAAQKPITRPFVAALLDNPDANGR